MVSLENRLDYLSRINENSKLAAFKRLLWGESISVPEESALSEAEQIYFGVTKAIQTDRKSDFEAFYNKKSKSNPSSDSPAPFVNDDFLLFSFIVGIDKFGLDKTWIKHIVSIRPRNEVAITFENILNKNFESTSNLPEIVLTFLDLTDTSQITDKLAGFAYKKVTSNMQLIEERSDFRLLSSIRCYDLIINLKTIPDGTDIYLLKRFDEAFSKRIAIVALILQFAVFFGLIYLLINLPKYSPGLIAVFEQYNYIFTLLGAAGITLLGNQIPLIKRTSRELLMRGLGYPKGLILLHRARSEKD